MYRTTTNQTINSLDLKFDSYTAIIFLIISVSSSVNFVVILTYKAGFRNRKFAPPIKPKLLLSEKESQSRYRRRLTETIISVPKSIINNRNDEYTECLFPTSKNAYIYRRTLCSYFILVLAVCDLFISLVNMPVGLIYQSGSLRSKILQSHLSILCPLGHFLYQIPIVLELEILSLIALDRYSSVFRSIDSYFFDKNKFIILTISSFLIACLISLPNIFLIGSDLTSCQIKPTFAHEQKIYQSFLLVVFVFNLSVIVTCYIRVYKHIYRTLRTQHLTKDSRIMYKRRVSCPVDLLKISFGQSQRADYLENLKGAKRVRQLSENQMNSSTGQNSSQSVKTISIRRHTSRKYKHTKTASVLALTIFLIVLTWSPFWLYKILIDKKAQDENCLLTKIMKNLYLLNYVLNPVFYSFINKRFRKNALYLAKSFCSSSSC